MPQRTSPSYPITATVADLRAALAEYADDTHVTVQIGSADTDEIDVEVGAAGVRYSEAVGGIVIGWPFRAE